MLDANFKSRLKHIRNHVKLKWKELKGVPAHITLHDDTHCKAVEKAIYDLIPKNKQNVLPLHHRFYLLAAAWLHDIGMNVNVFKQVHGRNHKNFEDLRSKHHETAEKYIMKKYVDLGLEFDEAKIIGMICKYHTKSQNILDPEVKEDPALQLLASYLRLADAIHVDHTRVDRSLFNIFLETGITWDVKYHWLKSFWVKKVIPDHASMKIRIMLHLSPRDDEDVNVIRHMIENEIREELALIKDILILGNISYFLDVQSEYGKGIRPEDRVDLKQLTSNFQLEIKPSASDVVDIVSKTIIYICTLDKEFEPYSTLRKYQIEVIGRLIENRPCHMLVRKVNTMIDNIMTESDQALNERQMRSRLKRLKKEISAFNRLRKKSVRKLLDHAKTILSDFESILLFGYSSLVIKTLETLKGEVKKITNIYVCECKCKNRYNSLNELVYCDGIKYVSEIRKRGYKKVSLVPDILIGNLFSRNHIAKVIFGANGVDIDTGMFGHTAGHLTIADLAYLYKIPVYVILDSHKFGHMKPNPELLRTGNWVTGDKKALDKLKGIDKPNPREDIVPPDRIYALVTDYGSFPPNKIPEAIGNLANVWGSPLQSKPNLKRPR